MIVLTHGKYIAGSKIFQVGDVLPDRPSVQSLVARNMAKIVADIQKKSAKTAKKPEPEKVDTAQENVKSDP